MELKGKFIVAFDTLCEGHQTATDDNGNAMLELFDSEADAMFEIFCDAISGLEDADDEYFEDNNLDRDGIISKMEELKEEGDSEKIKNFLDAYPETNYYDEFVVPADEFILGRKAIFTGQGIVIEGTPLEEIL
jgi:hypothetical protein